MSIRTVITVLTLSALGGCASLLPPPPMPDQVFVLEATPPAKITPPNTPPRAVLAVSVPRARAGYDSAQMVWVRQAHGLETYARHRWANTPAHMLTPILVQTLDHSGAFHAVVQAPSSVAANLRLDTEIVRLHQDFSVQPSRVHFTLAVQLVDIPSRRIIASTHLEESEASATEDAYGGVRAANRALERLLPKITAFCNQRALATLSTLAP
jgi:cholesterol transport system auxiliary component